MLDSRQSNHRIVSIEREPEQTVELLPVQKKIAEDLARELGKHVPLSERAILSFGMLSVADWQKETNTKIAELSNMGPREKSKHMSEIARYVFRHINTALTSVEHQHTLEFALQLTYDYYLDNYARTEV